MINVSQFKSLAEFMEHFKDEETCREHFAAIRFRNGAYCPHCGHGKVHQFKDGKRYRCADCKKDFTIITGTVFGETKLPLRKWFIAIYLLANSSKGISSVQLAKHAGMTQKSAWFVDHRLRSAMKQNKAQLGGVIEADETFLGGRATNMHAKIRKAKNIRTGGWDKTTVFGLKHRDGEVRAQVIPSAHALHLHKAVKETVAAGSTLYTDKWPGYHGLDDYKRDTVDHSAKEYVRGDVHTNGIESFWALFKRAYHGIYHQMSKKHMQKYVDECAFRLNLKSQEMGFPEIFAQTVTRAADGQQLPYKQLIA